MKPLLIVCLLCLVMLPPNSLAALHPVAIVELVQSVNYDVQTGKSFFSSLYERGTSLVVSSMVMPDYRGNLGLNYKQKGKANTFAEELEKEFQLAQSHFSINSADQDTVQSARATMVNGLAKMVKPNMKKQQIGGLPLATSKNESRESQVAPSNDAGGFHLTSPKALIIIGIVILLNILIIGFIVLRRNVKYRSKKSKNQTRKSPHSGRRSKRSNK